MIEIKNRYSGAVIFSAETESLRIAVELAVKSRADLRWANLSWANISGADLRWADLSWADLSGADLCGANLRNADLRGANLREADLREADLSEADLSGADLRWANLSWANISGADIRWADLRGADLSGANLSRADLREADLSRADLNGANLRVANLSRADLNGADLSRANISGADIRWANLRGANLSGANLSGTTGLVKTMGVEPGNCYWKRFDAGLKNNGFTYRVGLNTLRDGEVFADDERIMCSYPGFHFASRSWCAVNYPYRPLEGRIRIPEDAKINEPWATDGKASADRIEILQVFDAATGEDVTDRYR